MNWTWRWAVYREVNTVYLICLFLFLVFYILPTSKVLSGQVPTCDSAHSWWLYSAALLGNQATSTMTHSVTLSWLWANQSLCHPNYAECRARKRQVTIFNSLVWLDQNQIVLRQWYLSLASLVFWSTSVGLTLIGHMGSVHDVMAALFWPNVTLRLESHWRRASYKKPNLIINTLSLLYCFLLSHLCSVAR